MTEASPTPSRGRLLPGAAAIALWMLALAVIGVMIVLNRHGLSLASRTAILFLCTVFALAGLGLIRLRRWGWALTLGAVFLSMCFACYNLFRSHQGQWAWMAGVNFVFFLYLVRPEVTGRLR